MDLSKRPYVGQLDRPISLLDIEVVQDGVGQEKAEYKLFSKCWSKLSSDTGSQDIDLAVMNSVVRTYVVRYRKEIEQRGLKMVLEDLGVKYDIISVSPLGRRSHLVIKCMNEQ